MDGWMGGWVGGRVDRWMNVCVIECVRVRESACERERESAVWKV